MDAPEFKTLRAFLGSDATYVLPAPGGSIVDGKATTNHDGDLYLAALASKTKRRIVKSRTDLEYLQDHLAIVVDGRIFDTATDAAIARRVGEWIRELAN